MEEGRVMPILTRREAQVLLEGVEKWGTMVVNGASDGELEAVEAIIVKTLAAIESAAKHDAVHDDSVEVPF